MDSHPKNATPTYPPTSGYTPDQTSVIVVVLSLASLLMLIGYSWVLLTIVRTRTLHTASNFFLASLSVAEIFIGLLGSPSFGIFVHVGRFYTASIFSLSGLMYFSLIGYFLNAILVAGDKWFKISRPFAYVRLVTQTTCGVCLAGTWLLTLLGGLAVAFAHTFAHTTANGDREVIFGSFGLISAISVYVLILPSVVVITVFNIAIVRVARRQARAIAAAMPAPPRQLGPEYPERMRPLDAGDELPRCPIDRGPHAAPVDHQKSTRQFNLFFLTFLLAWFPLGIFIQVIYATAAAALEFFSIPFLVYCSFVLLQTAFGTLILTIIQPQFRQILKMNLRSLGKKIHCIRED